MILSLYLYDLFKIFSVYSILSIILFFCSLPIILHLQTLPWKNVKFFTSPVLGFSVLSSYLYITLSFWNLPTAMVVLFLLLIFHNLYYYQKFANFSFSQQHVIVIIVLFFLYLFLLSIYYFNNTLAIVVPNQDEEYFVEFVDSIWATPQGWRFNLAGSHLETGWDSNYWSHFAGPLHGSTPSRLYSWSGTTY